MGTLAHCLGLESTGEIFRPKSSEKSRGTEEGAGPSSKSSLVYRLGRRHRILWDVGRFGVYGVGYGAEEEKWAEARAIAVSQHLAFPFKIYIQYALKHHIWLKLARSVSLCQARPTPPILFTSFPNFCQYPAERRYRGKRRPQLMTSNIHAPSSRFRVKGLGFRVGRS